MKKTGLVNKIVYSKMTIVLLFFFLSIFIILSLWFYRKLNQSQKQRYLSYVAADELRQSSDDLTRMVRTYAMTKDPRYEEMYWDILAIRDGEKARPVRYENIYWDFMAFTHEKPRPDGLKISLIKMMEDLEFTQEEFAKLTQAEMHSNKLVWTETIAMHAMKGEFLDTEGEFTVKGEPNYDYARAILYDESYHSEKVDIMTPIDEFFVMVNARTEAKVNRDTAYIYICIFLVFITILLLLSLSRVELNKRKLAEQALRSSEANFCRVMVTSPDGIVIVDKDGVVQYVNPAAEYLFGRKAEQLLGEVFGLPFISGEVKEVEIVHLGREPGIAEMTVVETEWNGQNAYLVLLHDITERKRMEEQLEYSAKEWKTTFDSISDMISIHDKDFKITRVNKALADTLKKEPEELIGQTCYKLFHGTKEPMQNCPHLQCLMTKEPATTEVFEPRLGAYLGITTSPVFDENGEVNSSVHIVRDITEQKLAEKKLTEGNAKLREYDKLKDEFISTTSHELRTPLSIIMGAIRLVLDEIPGEIVPEQRDILVMAAENLQRLARIVDSLLSISRIESGKLGLEKTDVNICQLIENTVSHYKNLAQEKELSLECEVPKQEILIPLDQDRIQEVLINLLSNSFKFTPKGGTVKVTCSKKEDGISFSVQDSGKGIAKKDMPKLFDKFTQFSRKTGPGEKGTGLGLAIVKRLVEMHGGTIEAQSKINKGTTFTVFLPLASESGKELLFEETEELVGVKITDN